VTEPAEPLVAPSAEPNPELPAEPELKTPEDVARAIAKLSDEDAAFVLDKVARVLRKRKIQITGYLVGMVGWLVAELAVLVYIGTHAGFLAWLFLVPFGLLGAVLYGFGRWAERVSPALPSRNRKR
jgi:hypothetical protein